MVPAKVTSSSISVVIPTMGRATLLRTLRGVARQQLPPREIVVVTNGPVASDLAGAVQRSAAPLRTEVLRLPQPGLNAARNAGIDRARGDILALIDDDCVPSPTWTAAIQRVYSIDRRLRIRGGRIELRFEQHPPPWLAGAFRSYLSQVDWGVASRPLRNFEHIAGANLSFHRRVYDQAGPFDCGFGPGAPGPGLVNDDIEFIARVRQRGYVPGYMADAVVHHHVLPGRLTLRYFLERRYVQGASDLVLHRKHRGGTAADARFIERKLATERWRSASEPLSPDILRVYQLNLILCRVAYFAGIADGLDDGPSLLERVRSLARTDLDPASPMARDAFDAFQATALADLKGTSVVEGVKRRVAAVLEQLCGAGSRPPGVAEAPGTFSETTR
jgi:glycosyltransferase involved in cell wall biosynthesis